MTLLSRYIEHSEEGVINYHLRAIGLLSVGLELVKETQVCRLE